MKRFNKKFKDRTLVCAVIGLGYIGLPLLLLLSDLNFNLIGIDKDKRKINKLRKGKLEFLKNSLKAKKMLAQSLKKKNVTFTDDFNELKDTDIIFISVDTPIDNNRKPNNSNLTLAAKNIAKNIKTGAIIVIESTLAPKTTSDIFIPTVEKFSKLKINRDFYVAVCSERIRPSEDVFKDLNQFPRVIGTSSQLINSQLLSIYRLITKGDLDVVDILTAEIVKTCENALRDVKIAFSNEVSQICDELGASAWDVVSLVNKRYGFNEMLQPGIGVGGHCLPKDPWLLLSSTKRLKTNLIKEARYTNSYMVIYAAKFIANMLNKNGIKNSSAKVLVLGYSFIENCEDTRNSPSAALIDNLKKLGIDKIAVHDPYIDEFDNDPLKKAQGADCLVLTVKHNQFRDIKLSKFKKLMRTPIIFDCKNFFSKKISQDLGFTYYGLGALQTNN